MSIPALDSTSPFFVARGDGVHVYDQDGNRYLDSMGGLWCVNVGHGRKEMNEAISAQLDNIACFNTFGDVTNEPAAVLATRITDMLAEEDMGRAFFCLGGSDAVESALKISRKYWKMAGAPGKTHFISLRTGYHGVHFGGMTVSGMGVFKESFHPLLPGCVQVDGPFLYRNPWTEDPEELGAICAGILDREIEHIGADNVAAFIAEPVQGAGGVIVPPANYWPRVRKVCDKHKVLLIADEVVTGFGRSGCLFGARGWGVKPDIMCFAKGLTSGYIPLGATAVSKAIAETLAAPPPAGFFNHGYTYSGHPVGCAAALAALDIVEAEGLVENAAEVGAYGLAKLKPLAEKYEHLGDVRGKGLMIALDLVADKDSREPVSPVTGYSDGLAKFCQQNGVIVRAAGSNIIISPPLIFSRENADTLYDALDNAFASVPYMAPQAP